MVRAMSWVMRGTNGLHITYRTKAMAMLCTSFTSSTMAPIDGGVLISVIVIVLFVVFFLGEDVLFLTGSAHIGCIL